MLPLCMICLSCSDDEPFSTVGPDDDPHILSPMFPDRQNGELPVIAAISRDANFKMTLTVTPADYTDVVWYIDGDKAAEGDSIDIWVYSNCEVVQLTVNGKRLERKAMPKNGHLEWRAVYRPGSVKAVGYKGGKKVLTEVVETTGTPARIVLSADRPIIKADGRDVAVFRVELHDKKGRFVPTACDGLDFTVEGPVRILGVGNGDPAYRDTERPTDRDARSYRVKAFNGLAQILLQSAGGAGQATLTVRSGNLPVATYTLQVAD